ncbi:MAG: helix-turn-helix domain-containing protein [Ruminococcus sp.]|nr:helix-turn-helix domain-containing protein [Ruminococcus sp.]MCM1380962.1 helix-turn-helix domain-containing protein [Muribaculaceae bacterium]MCM1478625.1 helix-turn-helix domain-containing protein [Muribaculaceae bacterium]
MAELSKDFKGVWIPKEIWLDKRLNVLEKIILAEIDSLDNDEKGCYASNDYIAEFCGCSKTKASTAISKLIDLGCLSAVHFDGRKRKLKSRLSKNERQTFKKCTADFQNLKEININNNTDNISSVPSDERDFSAEKADKNTAFISVKEAAEHIYSAYPRKEGKAKGFEQIKQLLKGKNISGIGRVKFNHEQLFCAVRDYAIDCEESGRETKFIQLFGTFMGKTVIDYAEKSACGYEEYMQRKYGEEWRSVKFVYKT